MAREHRHLDGETGELTVFPFTAEEEAAEDKRLADDAAQEALERTDEFRIDAAFPQTDVARVIFEALFEISNRVITLEGGTVITRNQLKTWLKNKLP